MFIYSDIYLIKIVHSSSKMTIEIAEDCYFGYISIYEIKTLYEQFYKSYMHF